MNAEELAKKKEYIERRIAERKLLLPVVQDGSCKRWGYIDGMSAALDILFDA